jgi:hypothetical protein
MMSNRGRLRAGPGPGRFVSRHECRFVSRLSEQAIAYFLFAALQQFYFDENKRTARCQINGYLMSHGFDAIRVTRLASPNDVVVATLSSGARRCGNDVVRSGLRAARPASAARPAPPPPDPRSPGGATGSAPKPVGRDPGLRRADGSGPSPDRCRPGREGYFFLDFLLFLLFLLFLATPLTPFPARTVNDMLTEMRQHIIDRLGLSIRCDGGLEKSPAADHRGARRSGHRRRTDEPARRCPAAARSGRGSGGRSD